MKRLTSLIVGVASLGGGLLLCSAAVATAQAPFPYPLDEKLANTPAPWTVPGKWGARGNWGR